jgi:hypothetical protein
MDNVITAMNGLFESARVKLGHNDTRLLRSYILITDWHINRGAWSTDNFNFDFDKTKDAVMSF